MKSLGIDTSNYTCSAALFDSSSNVVHMKKKLLPVPKGALGLRQSQAVFEHVRLLGDLLLQLYFDFAPGCDVVGVSTRPCSNDESYMPCFLVGKTVAQSIAASAAINVKYFTHQQGHIAAALYSAGHLELLKHAKLIAFHVSGGTTDCLLVTMHNNCIIDVQTIGHSLDLKAGQVIDRLGVKMGLAFPAGKQLEELAVKCFEREQGKFHPKISLKGTDCCLSGLENQCKKMLKQELPNELVACYCLCFIRDTLEAMLQAAYRAVGKLPVLFSGGVMSNLILQRYFFERYRAMFAQPQFSSDNAAGVALLACGESL